MARPRELGEALLRFGLSLPGAREDHPWGELVLKAGAKVFVFLGKPGDALRFSVKLPRSGERLLDQDWAEPTGYGLGKSGWLTLSIEPGAAFAHYQYGVMLRGLGRAEEAQREMAAACAAGLRNACAPGRAR